MSTTVSEEGLDVPSVELIICYELSLNTSKYIQRRGRTGRNKFEGEVIYLVTTQQEIDSLISF